MSITPAGSFASSTSSNTLAVTTAHVGDAIFCYASATNQSQQAVGVTGGNATGWVEVAGPISDSGIGASTTIWMGTVTAVGQATITVTWNSPPAGRCIDSLQFTAGLGAGTVWSVDNAQAATRLSTATRTVTFPTLTPTAGGSLYTGIAVCAGSGGAGSTPGFVYNTSDGFANIVLYNLNVTAASAPTGTDSVTANAIAAAVLIKASAGGGGGTGDTTPPSVPTGLAATPSATQVALAWNAASDNIAVTGYTVRRDGVVVGTPTGTTFTDTGVTAGGSYSYTVDAADAAGNHSAQSAPASATVPGSTVLEDFEDTTYNVAISGTWTRTTTQAQAGTGSLRSGAITDNQTTDAVVAVPAGATACSFWYRVSSESGYDFFDFLTDAISQLHLSGTIGWTQSPSYDLTGVTTLTFRYAKDVSVSAGEDAAYIDNLAFTLPAAAGPSPAYADQFLPFLSA